MRNRAGLYTGQGPIQSGYSQLMAALKRLLSRFKRKPEVSGVSVAILQKRLERYSDDRLNVAMSRALGRKHDERTFFALSIFDGDGAVIKIDRLIIGIQHFDRRIYGAYLGNNELPAWAEHSAHSVIEFRVPGRPPRGGRSRSGLWLARSDLR
jgi:hypothetical protein